MGADTPREVSGPIRRFPTGFWSVFNQWWHNEFKRLGQRPPSRAIGRWHEENALKVWGHNAVSYAETQRHANRMKCRRAAQSTHANTEEEDEGEGNTLDTARTGAAERSTRSTASRENETGAEGSSSPLATNRPHQQHHGHQHQHRQQQEQQQAAEPVINFNAQSDPPGGLLNFMKADSDLPAPAAPSQEAPTRPGAGRPAPQAPWLQPDPVSLYLNLGLQRSLEGAGIASAAAAAAGIAAGAAATAGQPQNPSLPSSDRGSTTDVTWRSAAQAGEGAVAASAPADDASRGAKRYSREDSCGDPDADRLAQRPRRGYNPFGEAAAAATAAAAASTASRTPAARDAAALLDASGAGSSSPGAFLLRYHHQQLSDPRVAPTWMRRVALELEGLMRDLGLLSGDGTVSDSIWRRSALRSSEPLRLPEPRCKRDPGALLGLAGSCSAAGGKAPAAAIASRSLKAHSGASLGLSGAQASPEPQQLLRGGVRLDAVTGGGGVGLWLAGRQAGWRPMGSGGGSGNVLAALDSIPLEALL